MRRVGIAGMLALLALLPVSAAVKTTRIPNLSGTWILDSASSRTGKSDRQVTMVVIDQSPPEIRFDYWNGERDLGVETISTNGKSRQRYSSRVEKALTYGRFQENTLLVSTDHVINADLGQQYTETEEWTLSQEGNTLTHKLSNGKVEVYRRQKAGAPER